MDNKTPRYGWSKILFAALGNEGIAYAAAKVLNAGWDPDEALEDENMDRVPGSRQRLAAAVSALAPDHEAGLRGLRQADCRHCDSRVEVYRLGTDSPPPHFGYKDAAEELAGRDPSDLDRLCCATCGAFIYD